MPNWVFNSLVVSGDKPTLEKMVEQLSTSYTRPYSNPEFNKETNSWDSIISEETINSPFSFWNVVAPTDLDSYLGQEKIAYSDSATQNFGSNFIAEFNNKVEQEDSWYYWNLRNWGCKWDASDVQFEWTDKEEAMYHFSTPWSPAVEVIETLSTQYPTLKFNLEFEEEQGWGAEIDIVNGEQETIREWDIPNSHADHKALDRECSCEIGDLEYAYPDCPVTDPNYYYDEEQYGWYEKVSDPSAMLESSN